MRRWPRLLAFLGASFLVAGTVSVLAQDASHVRIHAPTIDDELMAELEEGEPEVTSNREDVGNRFIIYAVVKADPDRVFGVIRDFPNTTQWVPDQTEATVLETRGRFVKGRVTTHMPWPFSDRTFELWMENYPGRVGGVNSWINRWQSIHGVGNLDDTHGYWLVQPHPRNPQWSIIKNVIYADIGVAIPRFLIRWGANSVMKESIYNLRERLGLPRDED